MYAECLTIMSEEVISLYLYYSLTISKVYINCSVLPSNPFEMHELNVHMREYEHPTDMDMDEYIYTLSIKYGC